MIQYLHNLYEAHKGGISMRKKEDQNFELLNSLKTASEIGIIHIEDVIFQSPDTDVNISETYVKTGVLDELLSLLKKVQKVKTLKRLKQLLKKNAIPIQLIVMDEFWGDFYELICTL